MHIEHFLLPNMERLVRREVWVYRQLPGHLQSVDELEGSRDAGWIDLQLTSPGAESDWTQECDTQDWVARVRKSEGIVFEVRVSEKALQRLDDLRFLKGAVLVNRSLPKHVLGEDLSIIGVVKHAGLSH